MEIQVRRDESEQIGASVEAERFAVPARHRNGAAFAAIDLRGSERAQVVDRAIQARMQFGEGGFVILELQRLHPGQTRRRVLDPVGGDLHLAQQREHVRVQTHLQQHACIKALRLRMGFALHQQLAQIAQGALADRHGGLVHRKGVAHGVATGKESAESLRPGRFPD